MTSFPTHLLEISPIPIFLKHTYYIHYLDQHIMSNGEAEKKVVVKGQQPVDEALKKETKEQVNE